MTDNVLLRLWNDDGGFVVSAELVLVSTIAVLACVVGLAEISNGINQELEDVASAFGSVNQTYSFSGLCGHKGHISGSRFKDFRDDCDGQKDITCDLGPQPEIGKHHHWD